MEPAYPFVLTSNEHSLIGEMVEIMGTIDNTMIETVARMLGVNRATANTIMGSTKAASNGSIWAEVVRSRFNDPEISDLVNSAVRELADAAQARNDFIHALFTPDYVEAGYMEPGIQTTSATRIKSGKSRPTSEVQGARDAIARLSCLIAHIDYCTVENVDRSQSPWHGKLGPPPRPHLPTAKPPRPAKVPKRQP